MTQQNKNILLFVGFALAMFISFQLAISKTTELKKETNLLKSQELFYKTLPKELALQKQKKKYYDSIFNQYELNGNSIQNNLLKSINTFSKNNNLKVITFSEPHIEQKNDLTIKTYQFSVQGNYKDIIQLIFELEQQRKFGEITNLHFEKKKNFRTGKNYLEAQVLLKSFG